MIQRGNQTFIALENKKQTKRVLRWFKFEYETQFKALIGYKGTNYKGRKGDVYCFSAFLKNCLVVDLFHSTIA